MKNIINISLIKSAISYQPSANNNIQPILDKALKLKKLSLNEIAVLLHVEDKKNLKKIYTAASKLKEIVFGKRVVLFTPLYISNECVNNCLYCGFRSANKSTSRITMTIPQIIEQAKILEKTGFKRILLVASENPKKVTISYITSAIKAIYKNTNIRIVHLNSAPFDATKFSKLHKAGLGVYQLFQETYHPETYFHMHPGEHEKEYYYRITAMDRAIEGGINDIGIGALFGLYDYKFETLSLIAHSRHLEKKFGCAAHTISVPRLRPAEGASVQKTKYVLNDKNFKKVIAVLRLAVPTAGIVVSTRESARLRNYIINIGASQISAGSRTSPCGYSQNKKELLEQFKIEDSRPLDKVIFDLAKHNTIPSLCTTCYRVGRTGHTFTKQARKGVIKNFCLPNALLTLEEYILDYADLQTKNICDKIVHNYLKNSKKYGLPKNFVSKLESIKNGKRDVYY
ncbi:MAG: [FeFe] hydrogenase H-cluster radical SAM maturase HydG [Candidatus Firestonebacteria bacterium]|nr:[FeFe] hydrogenase H-cluster radical SAM maturase HydG [Candidatus Firestonebacteria bacterium]